MTYASMENPEGISRTLSPTVIITVNGRQHVRAYDWGSSAFKDFVLARFLDLPELIVPAPAPPRKDTAWEVIIPVRFIANPTLNKAQQEVIKRDYLLEPSEFNIRAPMIFIYARKTICLKQMMNMHKLLTPAATAPLSTLF